MDAVVIIYSAKGEEGEEPSEQIQLNSLEHVSTVPILIEDMGKEGRTLIGPRSNLNRYCCTRYSNYLDGYWSCTSGLSAVNAIGT